MFQSEVPAPSAIRDVPTGHGALVIPSVVTSHLVLAGASGWEESNTYLAIAVLAVASATLWFTYPRPARLDIDRLSEMDEYTADLLFFVYPKPNPDDQPVVPRDYLLQLRVAVANVGRRKAVLSTIAIEEFITESGKAMFLPESVQGPLWGSQWKQQSGFVGGRLVLENMSSPGPYVLGPDDVVVVTFRSRRGIDWSGRWDLAKLRSFHDDLADPFVSVRGKVVWRRASWWRSAMELRVAIFSVDLKVLQQDEYIHAIEERTADFTVLPDIEHQPISIE